MTDFERAKAFMVALDWLDEKGLSATEAYSALEDEVIEMELAMTKDQSDEYKQLSVRLWEIRDARQASNET